MISRKTTLVLGAGASAPYGLPVGSELRAQICALPRDVTPLLRLVHETDGDVFVNFRKAFERSGLQSIDSFLARNVQFEELGCTAIAACLLFSEQSKRLRYSGEQLNTDWYGYLWNEMVDGVTDIEQLVNCNNVSFITFNYDRSLEAFLQDAIQFSFNLSPERAWELRRKFPIHHIYGSLGDIGPSLSGYGIDGRDEAILKAKQLRSAASSIRVMPIQRQTDVDTEAQSLLHEAQQIAILGFSFDAINVSRLGIADVLVAGEHQVYFTSLGMSASALSRARNLISPDQINHSVTNHTGDCHTALRHWGILGAPA